MRADPFKPAAEALKDDKHPAALQAESKFLDVVKHELAKANVAFAKAMSEAAQRRAQRMLRRPSELPAMRSRTQEKHRTGSRWSVGGSPPALACTTPHDGAQTVLAADDFETEVDSIEEDRVRRQALQNFMPIVPPVGWTNIGAVLKQAAAHIVGRAPIRLDREAALALCNKLDADAEQPTMTVASAVAMRRIRPATIGALIDALADYPDEELCTITVVKPTWVYTPAELSKVSARTIKRAFEQDLRRAGISEIDGPFVGFLHGEYELTNNVYVLHFHCTTTLEKARFLAGRLRGLKRTYCPKGIVKKPIRVSKMKNRVGQLTYILKRYWTCKPILMIDGVECRRRKPIRVPEPYSSAYLLWLDQQPLIDLTVSIGTWSKRKGGLAAWRAFYLIVKGVGNEKRSEG